MRAVVQGICAYDVINCIWLNPFPLETGSIENAREDLSILNLVTLFVDVGKT